MNRKAYGIKEIAEAIGQRPATVWAWMNRGVRDLPPPDDRISTGPVWLAATIEPWISERMSSMTWQEKWARRDIDRHQAEQDAWEAYVGEQSVSEFVEISRQQGQTDIEEMAQEYVAEIPNMMPEIQAEDLPEDLDDLLAGYIERNI